MKSSHSATLAVLTIGGLLALVALGYRSFSGNSLATKPANSKTETASSTTATSTSTPTPTPTPTTASESGKTRAIKLALLNTEGTVSGRSRGCDTVVFVERTIPETERPLAAALTELFALNTEKVGILFHFIARTNETLRFERVTLSNGIAKVYLTGSLSGLQGVCDDPRASIQIEETAKQFATVKAVELYLNGKRSSLVPSQKGE